VKLEDIFVKFCDIFDMPFIFYVIFVLDIRPSKSYPWNHF